VEDASAAPGPGSSAAMVEADTWELASPSPAAPSGGPTSPLQRSDCEAFLATLDAHDHTLRTLAFRMLNDRDQMDDVLQEVALKAFRALPKFRGDAALATWLYRITYTTCLNRLRSRRATLLLPDPADDGAGDLTAQVSTADTADDIIRRIELSVALASLNSEQRAVVALVLEEGLDHRTAAKVLDIPMGTVASRLAAARTALRRCLSEPTFIGETG
jgi:RNA polymerase sigma-70 factor (ECF subfamily)